MVKRNVTVASSPGCMVVELTTARGGQHPSNNSTRGSLKIESG